jgi:hypothetical protein
MRKLVEITSGNSKILVEAHDVEYKGSTTQAGGPLDKDKDKMLEKLRPFCDSIVKYFQKLTMKPDNASAEFGLGFSLEGNVFVAKASAEASIKVTLHWTLTNKNAAGS